MRFNQIQRLPWDTNFFGYPVAKVFLTSPVENLLDKIFEQLAIKKIRLTYFFVPESEQGLDKGIIDRGCILIDKKTDFLKKTQKYTSFSNKIIEYQETAINERLAKLVLQAGVFSRFRTDKNFINNEFERLYTEWLRKSLSKEIAYKTFIAIKNSEIVGFTTLTKKDGIADIGLVAVDENFRGSGIGSDLIHSADNSAFEMGYREIKVITQLQNKPGCKLYEKCNFHIDSIVNVYHYWQ
jgi:dTDP-4-amino-4,6-dideoxy-D-galactose acyltransferase